MSTLAASRPGPLAIPLDGGDCVAVARMTFDEWLDWDHEGGLTEWVDGEMKVHMPASRPHQSVTRFLVTLATLHAEATDSGTVQMGPYGMQAVASGPGREPDVMFVSRESGSRMLARHLVGPADLVIEVVSSDSVTRDNREKLRSTSRREFRSTG